MRLDTEVGKEPWIQVEHCQTEGHVIMQKGRVLQNMLPKFSCLVPTWHLGPLLLSPLPTAPHNRRNRFLHVLIEEAFFEKYVVQYGSRQCEFGQDETE